MDPSIQNVCNGNINIGLYDLDNIRVEDLTPVISDAKQHQTVSIIVNNSQTLATFTTPTVGGSEGRALLNYQVQVPLTSTIVAQETYRTHQPSSSTTNVNQFQRLGVITETEHSNYIKQLNSGVNILESSALSSYNIPTQAQNKKLAIDTGQFTNPFPSQQSDAEPIKAPKKPRTPREPKVDGSKMEGKPNQESSQTQTLQIVNEEVLSTLIKKRAPRKPQGPRKLKESLPVQEPISHLRLSLFQSSLEVAGLQPKRLQSPSSAIELPSLQANKPKVTRKYTPRKSKPQPPLLDVQSELNLASNTTLPKVRGTKKSQKLQGQPSNPTNDGSNLTKYFESVGPPETTSSNITLHYEQYFPIGSASVNPLNKKHGNGQQVEPSFEQHLLHTAGSGNNTGTDFVGSMFNTSVENSNPLQSLPKSTSHGGVLKYGKSPSPGPVHPFDKEAIMKYEQLKVQISAPTWQDLSPVPPVTFVQQKQTSHNPISGGNQESHFYSSPHPNMHLQLPLIENGQTSVPPVTDEIKSFEDLSFDEKECLKMRRRNALANSLRESSTISSQHYDSTEMTDDELFFMNDLRHPGKYNISGTKKKKTSKNNSKSPSLVAYPMKEPRKCATPKNKRAAKVSPQNPQGVLTQPSQYQSQFFSFYSQTPRKETASTYEQTIGLHRQLLNPTMPTIIPSMCTQLNSTQYSFPMVTPSYEFPSSLISTPSVTSQSSSSKVPGISLPSEVSNENSRRFSNTSMDSVIDQVSSIICGRQSMDQLEPPTISIMNPISSPLSCLRTSEERAKPKKTYSRATKYTKLSKNESNISKSTEPPTKQTRRGLSRKPMTPKEQKIKSVQDSSRVTTVSNSKSDDEKAISGQENWDIPEDLSFYGCYKSPQIPVASTPSAEVDVNKFTSLRDFYDKATCGYAIDEFGETSIPSNSAVVGNNVNLGSSGVISVDSQATLMPQIILPKLSPFSSDQISQFKNIITNSSSRSIPCIQQSVSITPTNIKSETGVNFCKSPFDTINMMTNGQMSTLSKLPPDFNLNRNFSDSSRGSQCNPSLSNSLQLASANQVQQYKPKLKDSERRLKSGNTKSPTKCGLTSMSATSQSIPLSYATIFPVQPLLKGTGRIPKLPVAKNKNPAFIGGQGRTTSQTERGITLTKLGSSTSETNPVGTWQTLRMTPKHENGSRSFEHNLKKIDNVTHKQFHQKIRRQGESHIVNQSAGGTNISHNSSFCQNSGLLRIKSSNPNSGQLQADLKNIMLKDKRKLNKSEVPGLKRGFATNWAYTDKERDFLYREGQYLIKREDIGKKRNEVDVWRIELGFKSMRRYIPQVDFSRVFHMGVDTFVSIKKDINLYRFYQPIYVSICIETSFLQVVQYFQAERFLPHLMFMHQNEDLYEDYYHLLQILICQVMDPNIIKEAILTEPGDKQWKLSWSATEEMLTGLAEGIRKHNRWQKYALGPIIDWPKMTMSISKIDKLRKCDACTHQRVVSKRLRLWGTPYDRTEFFRASKKPEPPNQKTQVCHTCGLFLRIFARVTHAKNDIFGCVRQRILQLIKSAPPGIKFDPLNIRDFLMDDHIWVRRMFYDYLVMLAEAHKLIKQLDNAPKPRKSKVEG